MFGLLNLSFWGYVIATFILVQMTIASVTLFLHRNQAHRAVDFHPIVSHFLRFWLWLTTGMVTRDWVAVHRKHHATTEKEGDPHSPQVSGLRKVLLEGVELYRVAAQDKDMVKKYSYGTPDDWLERNVYIKRTGLGIRIMLVLNLLLFGLPGITIWGIQMLWIPFFAAGVINGVGHAVGYRNFESPDTSTNLYPIAFFIGGEELHNNHHAFASSAKFSIKWWEFDIGWFYIRILSLFGLAKVKKLPPKLVRDANRLQVDMDTVRVLLNNRFQIMARYAKEVMNPVFKEEKRKAPEQRRGLFRRSKKLLVCEQTFMDNKAQYRLSRLLKQYRSLQLVYQYRIRLQEIWANTTHNPKELLEALQAWCKQAERTGIESLGLFAKQLKFYVSVPVTVQS